jgi:hypothetical protein
MAYEKLKKQGYLSVIILAGMILFCANNLCGQGKWGVLDAQGSPVIPFIYDEITPFTPEGYAVAILNGKKGVLSKTGKPVIPFEYEDLKLYSSEGLITAKKNGLWGILNVRGMTIVPLVHALSSDRYGKSDPIRSLLHNINTDEKVIPLMSNIEIETKMIDGKATATYSAAVTSNTTVAGKSHTYIEESTTVGEQIPFVDAGINCPGSYNITFIVDRITTTATKRTTETTTKSTTKVSVEQAYKKVRKNQILLLDYSGNVRSSFVAGEGDFSSFFLLGSGLIAYSKTGINGWGIMNENGKVLAPAGKYDIVAGVEGKPVVKVAACSDRYACKYGLINTNGAIAAPISYDDIRIYKQEQGKDIPANKAGKMGTIDILGKEHIPFNYSMLNYISDEYYEAASIGANPLYGVVNGNGKEIIPCKYEKSTTYFPKYGIGRLLNRDYMYALCDEAGKLLTGFDYDEMFEPSEDMIAAVKNIKCGFLNKEGKEVIPFIYNEVGKFYEGLVPVSKDRKWGVIDKAGNEVVPFGKYDKVFSFAKGKAIVYKNNKCGVIDKAGNEIIPLQYSQMIYSIDQGYIITKQ